jgi:hypothetical protein
MEILKHHTHGFISSNENNVVILRRTHILASGMRRNDRHKLIPEERSHRIIQGFRWLRSGDFMCRDDFGRYF